MTPNGSTISLTTKVHYKIQMHVADKRNYKQLCVQCNKNQMHFMLDNMSDNLFIEIARIDASN